MRSVWDGMYPKSLSWPVANDTSKRIVHPSNHTVPIDYRDRRSVNYLDDSHIDSISPRMPKPENLNANCGSDCRLNLPSLSE